MVHTKFDAVNNFGQRIVHDIIHFCTIELVKKQQLELQNVPKQSSADHIPKLNGEREPTQAASAMGPSGDSAAVLPTAEEVHLDGSTVAKAHLKHSWQQVAHVVDVLFCFAYVLASVIVFVLYVLPLMFELNSEE